MRVHAVRISGFRSIPVCATYAIEPLGKRRRETARIDWASGAFSFTLPAAAAPGAPMLAAIIGPNSAGKSTILAALGYAFSPATKLDETLFHAKNLDHPVIVEITLVGPLPGQPAGPTQWQAQHCTSGEHGYELTVAHVWTRAGRTRYIRLPDGRCQRQNQQDRQQCERLEPQFRLIAADTRLADEADMEKRTLLSDLVDALLARTHGGDSIVHQLHRLTQELNRLTDRSRSQASANWQAVEELELQLSRNLAAIAPQPHKVRLQLRQHMPTVRDLFAMGSVLIDDGVELDFSRQGLGLQRSFVVSALNVWCDYARARDKDYLFAIEEPEIYLHPHATRLLLNTLEEVAQNDQVLFTTHSVEFVNRTPLHHVLTVRRRAADGEGSGALVSQLTQPDLSALPVETATKVRRYLYEDRSDMLFARSVLLVEGQAELFALPAFARTLGLSFDAAGVSVVFVNGYGNFGAYHHILAAFGIPHVIFMDGDGQRREREQQFGRHADALYVLDQDFEALMVQGLTKQRLREVVQECLVRKGQPRRAVTLNGQFTGKDLASYGKPLVGRVLGEMLTAGELAAMPVLVAALTTARRLAQMGAQGGAQTPQNPRTAETAHENGCKLTHAPQVEFQHDSCAPNLARV
jgi:energy-coupling factor transporter ATP-binding protein EcfA2